MPGSPAPGSAARGLCRVRTLQPTAGPVNQVPAGVARSGASAKRQPFPWGLNRAQQRGLYWVFPSFSPAKLFLLSNFQWPAALPPFPKKLSHRHPAGLQTAPCLCICCPLFLEHSPSTLPLLLSGNTSPHPSNTGVPFQNPLLLPPQENSLLPSAPSAQLPAKSPAQRLVLLLRAHLSFDHLGD